jgi:predicted enzyme related to lactoylglutathione lyase
MPRVVHFEINADSPERAAKFYSDVFGWEVKKWDGPFDYWLAKTGEQGEMGIDGGIQKNNESLSSVVNTIGVENIEETLAQVAAAGGSIVMPVEKIPQVGFLAYCKDTEGIVFGVLQPVMD